MMEVHEYSPFGKDLSDVCAADLAMLRGVPEGWYIEYKRVFPGVQSAAKSISAFANSYGGWLFYGIEEGTEGRLAGSFPGIPCDELGRVEQHIRQAVSAYVSPPTYFEVRTFKGPDQSTGLSAERAVVVVRVPRGHNAPYLHGSGRIYRRVADESDPTHETDRHFLDLLWKRGEKQREEFSDFVKRKPQLGSSEQHTTLVRLLFFTDPWLERTSKSGLELKQFSALMGDEDPKSGGIRFDNIFTHSTGFIARYVHNNDPGGHVLTWKYRMVGISEITLPLNTVNLIHNDEILRFLNGYDQAYAFLALCRRQGLNSGWLVDLSQLYSLLGSLTVRLFTLLEAQGQDLPVFLKAQIIGAWRRVPFLDLPDFMHFVERYGIPVIQDEECFAPPGTDPDTCLELTPFDDEAGQPQKNPYLSAGVIFATICLALGVPHSIFWFHQDAEEGALERLLKLGPRAVSVSSQRINEAG
jgi:hypothetical protein